MSHMLIDSSPAIPLIMTVPPMTVIMGDGLPSADVPLMPLNSFSAILRKFIHGATFRYEAKVPVGIYNVAVE